ncbi:MAG: efflux RND transporter periplasmic adaptor subunit [Bryobacterales bacterium]|nr:efflux RND transporter periplasmic adaptor subunit [Bryobacterales bacterium]
MRHAGLLAIPIAMLIGCGDAPTAPPAAQTAAAPAGDPLEITPSESIRKDLRIEVPAAAEVGAVLSVAARLEFDETRITRVGSPVMGRIATLGAREGEEVKKGQLLATLSSTGLSEAQLTLLKATSQRQLAQRAVDRARTLLEAGVIGAAEVQRRDAELSQAAAEVDAARDQLTLLGMLPESIDELLKGRRINSMARVIASMDGIVLDRKITLGQVIQPADTVFEIADLTHLWMVADVPEQNAGRLQEGQTVEATIGALPNLTLRGKLSFISHTVNPETRTVRVRMELPNPKGRYKPAMLATMLLKEHTEKRTVVPVAAVVREENVEHVFVQRAEGTYVLRPVTLGDEFDGRRVLISGLQPGDAIVTQGAFHLNNERRRRNQRGQGE